MEDIITPTTIARLFNERTFLIDDTSVYRVTITKSEEGNLCTSPMNGALLAFDPQSGRLYLHVVHKSAWSGLHKLGQAAKQHAAELIASLLDSLAVSERPTQLVCSRSGMIQPLQEKCEAFDVKLAKSSFYIPFQSLIKLDQVFSLVNHAESSSLHVFDLYSNWLNSVTSYTAFSRLCLRLRALHVNPNEANAATKHEANNALVWIEDSDEEWIQAETRLKNLIVEDYAQKNNLDASLITPLQIRDVILGHEIAHSHALSQ
jgi:pre-mRNA-processing factor 8